MPGATLFWLAIVGPRTLLSSASICRPIARAELSAKAIAQGDLTDHHIDVEGNDEAARLLRSLAAMQHSLGSLVGQVRQSTDSISTASSEIATGNQDLSARTEQVSEEGSEVAVLVDYDESGTIIGVEFVH